MSFITQILLSDVPTFESERDSLVSFHYCQQCSYDGNMAWGWSSSRTGYDVSVITGISDKNPDGLGILAEVVIDPRSVSFHDETEVPGYEDTMNMFHRAAIPQDYPWGTDDFDEAIYPGIVHVAKRKVGGWPTWVQYPEPPPIGDHERLHFLGQLDWWLCDRTTWCAGGYAYLFLISSEGRKFRGELALQTT